MKLKRMMAASASLALVAVLAACGGDGGSSSSSGGGKGSVTFVGWGGTGQKALTEAWLEPFTKETGIEVVQDTPSLNSKLEQMVKSKNVIWDVMDYGAEIGLVNNPNLEKIDCSIVPCDDFKNAPFKALPQGVPMYIISFVLTYNTNKVKEAPRTRAEAMFDTKKYPGKRAINGISGTYMTLLEPALLADGVAQEDLYPLDIERALKKIETIKDDIIVYKESSECVNLVSSGEAIFGDCYNGRAKKAKDEGLPVDFIWSQQTLAADWAMIPKGAPNKENAMKLIAYMTDKKNSGRISERFAYAGANPLTKAPAGFESNSPLANMGKGEHRPIFGGLDWWPDNRSKVIERMAEWFNK
ncbi:ABC transporter substrate-binding protein [Streptomyces sp. NPDC004838]